MTNDGITQADLWRAFHYEPTTGLVTRAIDAALCGHNRNRPAAKRGDVVGYFGPGGYLYVRFNGRLYRLHRIIWLYVYGEWPKQMIDHIDGNRLNNAISNLREATPSQNQQNKTDRSSRNRLGLLGVSFHKASGKYRAQIKYDGRLRWLGTFATPEAASAAYWQAKREHHEYCPAD